MPIPTQTIDIAQVHNLTQALQKLARDAGHARPLMIGTDQENGSSLSHIQFMYTHEHL